MALGRQTAIHEQVLNTQSTEELMGLYEDWAADYDRDVNENWGYSGLIGRCIGCGNVEADGARILDAGCGTGLVAVALAQGGFTHIDGIDYSQAMLGEAAKKGVYQTLSQMNMNEALPIAAGTYGGVTCVGTFTSAHVIPEALNELVRVTRDGGTVCCTVRDEYWRETHFADVLNSIVSSGRAQLQQLCDLMSTLKSRSAKWSCLRLNNQIEPVRNVMTRQREREDRMHVMNNGTEAASLQTLRDVLSGRESVVPSWIGARYCRAWEERRRWHFQVALGQVEIPPGQIRLMFNENPYGPSPKALAEVAKILPMTAYYPGEIENDLMSLFMERHNLDRDQVFLASGSNEGLQAAMMAFGKRGKVISPALTYSDHLLYAEKLGVEVQRIRDDMAIDLEAMARAVDDAVAWSISAIPTTRPGWPSTVTNCEASAASSRPGCRS